MPHESKRLHALPEQPTPKEMLIEIHDRLGLQWKDLAFELGITHSQVSNWLSGLRTPHGKQLEHITAIYRVARRKPRRNRWTKREQHRAYKRFCASFQYDSRVTEGHRKRNIEARMSQIQSHRNRHSEAEGSQ